MSATLLIHETVGSANVMTLKIPHPMDDELLDLLNVQLSSAIDGKGGRPWILDLASVSYMGSSMLGWLINLRHQIKTANGSLVLCGLSPALMDLFLNSSMQRLFIFSRDRNAALSRAR